MDKFETQFTDLDAQTSIMEDAMSSTTAVSTPQDQIDLLLRQTADEANIELQQDLASKDLSSVPEIVASSSKSQAMKDEDDKLADRLRALRPVVWAVQAFVVVEIFSRGDPFLIPSSFFCILCPFYDTYTILTTITTLIAALSWVYPPVKLIFLKKA